eukprot:259731-Chlamydomonas_euryale.AAC.14
MRFAAAACHVPAGAAIVAGGGMTTAAAAAAATEGAITIAVTAVDAVASGAYPAGLTSGR